MLDINKVQVRGTITKIQVQEAEGRKCARFTVLTFLDKNSNNNEDEKTYQNVSAFEGPQTDPVIFTAGRNTYVHLTGHLRQTQHTDAAGEEYTTLEIVADRLKCKPKELHMETEKPEWRFAYEEDIFDMLGYNAVGVLTNGESYLFYHIVPEEEDKIETCHIYASLMNMYDLCPEISYPATEENDIKLLEALNSLAVGEESRTCGENSILHEIKFTDPI